MKQLTHVLKSIAGVFEGTLPNVGVSDVTTDSRLVGPGSIFVAVKGSSFDGHSAIASAISSGAVAIVAETSGTYIASVPLVLVPNSRLAYAQLVNYMFDNPVGGLSVYGVTGTNGKTTCATLLEQMFADVGRAVGFIGTTGNRFRGIEQPTLYTTPHADTLAKLFIEMRQASVETVCMEVSSHALDQQRVFGVPFKGAMFTNLSRDHLDYHRTMEAYANTKKRLFDMLSEDAVAVLVADSEWTPYMKRNCKAGRCVTVGMERGADVRIVDIELSLQGSSFTLQRSRPDILYVPEKLVCATPLLGIFNVTNAALCAVMCLAEGVSPEQVVHALSLAKGPAGRMEHFNLRSGAVAVVDYAHTPDALHSVLSAVGTLHHAGHSKPKINLVFGCGGGRDHGKRPLMGQIAVELADHVWITNDNPRDEDPSDIARHILAGIEGSARERVTVVYDRREAIRAAMESANANHVVLIAGKGHEEYQVIGLDRLPFSDVAEVLEFCR